MPDDGHDERRKLAIASYFGLITFLDEQIGRVIGALQSAGLTETTRIIYASDHGDNMGARGLWNKCVMYRESTSVPLIMAGPGVQSGAECRTHVNLVDIYPTVLDAFGIDLTASEVAMPGESLFRTASRPYDPERRAFSEYHAVGAATGCFMLAHGRYKFHYYVGYSPELFDIDHDPEEVHDLAGDSRYAAVVAEFEAELRAMLNPEEIDRRAKDAQNDLVRHHGGRDAALNLGNKNATPTPIKFQTSDTKM